MKLVAQKNPMGCGIACVASVTNLTYSKALRLVNASHTKLRGYYCKELVAALEKQGLRYSYGKAKGRYEEGTIVFIARSKKYPAGHYLLRTRRGWMNPWINYPAPAKAGFNKRLPGRAQWVIYPT